jgi:protein-disulfide isomerase
MKRIHFLTAAVAVMALAGCNKSNGQGNTAAIAADSKVTITQAAPPPGGSWTDVVNQTTDGYLMGNPNAKVKLIEIASLGCPYCKKFDDEGVPTLMNNYVKSGKISWEFRPYPIHGPVDIAAELIASCNGIKGFFPLALALYKDQQTWMGKIETAPQDKLAQIQQLPGNQPVIAMADLAGLPDWAAARGVPHAKSQQCLADQKMTDHFVQVASDVNNDYPDFKGTPSFVLNGKFLQDVGTWDKLKPQLDSAVNG